MKKNQGGKYDPGVHSTPDVNSLGIPHRCWPAAAEHSPASGEMLLGCARLAEPRHCFSTQMLLCTPGSKDFIIKEGKVIREETEKKQN